jgi:hypothetical protein
MSSPGHKAKNIHHTLNYSESVKYSQLFVYSVDSYHNRSIFLLINHQSVAETMSLHVRTVLQIRTNKWISFQSVTQNQHTNR